MTDTTWAYDLDGVLAQAPPKEWFTKPWGRLKGWERRERKLALTSWYRVAPALLEPYGTGLFYVISARKHADAYEVTNVWLSERYAGRPYGLHMLQKSRTLENVVTFKASVLRWHVEVSAYVEDNRAVLRGLQRAGVRQQLFFYSAATGVQPFP